ncbi:aldose epimerase family protein [Spongiivirga citrea]|uniref:Aldose 1-epimerase n=1 Tax=Spongiivirga citrea TaxID=1481457 RepID=A0A6M0CGI5_9FLAO|nr:aldose epimerase family protein [Spongiivirga citrea]NER16033.1 galactose mutarotase [Spongiivirga citrea]
MSKIILENSHLKVEILTYGAIIQRLFVKKHNDNWQNVVIGLNTEEDYKKGNPAYLGACIGPYAGRIDKGMFPLEGKIIQLDSKDGVHLHGGKSGFHMREWTIEKSGKGEKPFITLHLNNNHEYRGYSGNTTIKLTYTLVKNELQLHYHGTTDKSTLLNLTNHSYFNLGDGLPITEHTLFIDADHYLETDNRLIPTGKKIRTTNSAYDFKTKRKIESPFLDDTFILNNDKKVQACLSCLNTGLKMEVITDQPGMVVFTPKEGNSICFETQHFPDAPNHPNFPNTVLNPNEMYLQKTAFKFSLL